MLNLDFHTLEQHLVINEFDELEFSSLVDKKSKVIKKIEELDNGFQAIYNRVQKEFAENFRA